MPYTVIIFVLFVSWLSVPEGALANPQTSTKNVKTVQLQRSDVRAQIKALQADISKKSIAKQKLINELSTTQNKIEGIEELLKKTRQAQAAAQQELNKLNAQITAQEEQIKTHQALITRTLNQQYQQGMPSPAAALLSANTKNESLRRLYYTGYISQAQASQVKQLKVEKESLNTLKTNADQKQKKLNTISKEHITQQQALQHAQQTRHHLLAQLNEDILEQQTISQRLKADETRLSAIINQLGLTPKTPQASTNPKPLKPTETSPSTTTSSSSSNKPVKLQRPINGSIAHHFGQNRHSGTAWRGIFFSAPTGSKIHAVAEGTVIYSTTLSGYGNLIIIDHGNEFVSVYAYTQTLYKSSGEKVASGDVIATSGRSPDEELEGLYFELRKNAKPINPQSWFN